MKLTFTCKGAVLFFAVFICLLSKNSYAGCTDVNAQIINGPSALLCSGSSLQLQAKTNQSYTFYQWQIQTTGTGLFTNISGANTSTVSAENVGSYRVIVGNETCKDTSSITNVIALKLSGGNITGGPVTKICADSYVGALIGPAVMGDEAGVISYQWQAKEAGGAYQNIPLATGLIYNAGNVKVTTTFRRVVIDKCGNQAYSNELTFTIYELLKAGTLAPVHQTINAGETPLTINPATPSTGSGNLSYKWQSSPSVNGPWSVIDIATGVAYTPAALNFSTYYRRITYTDVCSYTATTDAVLIVVQNTALLNAGLLYSDNSCLFAGNIPLPIGTKIKPFGGVRPYLIEWEYKTASGVWTLIAGEHNEKLFPGAITETTGYRKKVTDAKGTVAYSDVATLNVISAPLYAGEIFATGSVACLGSSPAQIISTKSGANFGERGSYQWQVKTATADWTNIYGATRGYYQPQPITEKSQFRRVFIDSCGRFGRIAYSNIVEIDARPALNAGDIGPSTQVSLPGRVPSLLTSEKAPSGGTGSYVIWWEKAESANGPWTKITNTNSLQYQPIALNNTTFYRRIVRDVNCQAEKISFVIEVQVPEYPAMAGGTIAGSACVFTGLQAATLASGTVAAGGGIGPYTYQWEKRTGINAFEIISNATSVQYKPGILTATTQFRRKIYDSYGSFAYSDTFTISVIATQLVPGTIGVSNVEVCAGSQPGTLKSLQDASGAGSSARYQWQQRTGTNSYQNIDGANNKEYTPATITQTTFYRRVYSDECSGMVRYGYSNEVVIKVTQPTPLQAGIVQGAFITCSGNAPGLIRNVLSACGSCNLVYQWQIFNGDVWMDIAGASNASYDPGVLNNSSRYRRVVKDGTGSSKFSNEVEILVYPGIQAGIIEKETQEVCANTTPSMLSLAADCHYTNGTVTYQWQKSTVKTGPWTNIEEATKATYQPGAATVTTYYRLKVMSTTCQAVAYTNVASVIVNGACNFKIVASSNSLQLCMPITPVKVFVEDVKSCNNQNEVEWQFKAPNSRLWKPAGNTTLSLNINEFYTTEEAGLEWRLKIYNKECNSITYSNIVQVNRVSCRKNLPIVYPNPSVKGQVITVETFDIPHKLALTTIDGKKVNFKIVSNSGGFIKIQLPMLASGTYVLHITSAMGQWVKKIVVKG